MDRSLSTKFKVKTVIFQLNKEALIVLLAKVKFFGFGQQQQQEKCDVCILVKILMRE